MAVKWGSVSIAPGTLTAHHVGEVLGRDDSAQTKSVYLRPVHGSARSRSYDGLASAAARGSGPTSELGATRLDSELRDFLVRDDQSILGIVDEIRPDGTILVACGWFGRRDVPLRVDDVHEIRYADRELVLHPGLRRVEDVRAGAGVFARLLATLAGRSLGGKQSARR